MGQTREVQDFTSQIVANTGDKKLGPGTRLRGCGYEIAPHSASLQWRLRSVPGRVCQDLFCARTDGLEDRLRRAPRYRWRYTTERCAFAYAATQTSIGLWQMLRAVVRTIARTAGCESRGLGIVEARQHRLAACFYTRRLRQ